MSVLHVAIILCCLALGSGKYSCTKENLSECLFKLKSEANQQNQSFLSVSNLTVFPQLEYSSSQLKFSVCCQDIVIWAKTITVNPWVTKINAESPYSYSIGPSLTLLTNSSIIGRYFTLLMVDPDVPFSDVGTSDRPLVHWLAMNYNGSLSTVSTVQAYAGPKPPDRTHQYVMMVYEQPGHISDTVTASNYSQSGCSPVGRCLFNVNAFQMGNTLKLVGLTWIYAKSDLWVKHYNIKNRGQDPKDLCKDVPGYGDPCPTGSADRWQKSMLFILTVSAFSALLNL